MQITKNFSLAEMTVSQEAARNGLKNVPDKKQIDSLIALCENILQPLRDRVKKPIVVSSGYRSVTINRRIGGSAASQHCKGEAADFTIPGMSIGEIVAMIKKMGLPVDQCIDEFGSWVHVSYGPRNRRQYLVARREGGKTVYKPL